jgi:hypothetical protein
MTKFTKRPFAKTLCELLLTVPGFRKKDGSLNVSKAAKDLHLRQPTLKRWIDGLSLFPDKENADKVCRRFRISYDQLVGDLPIPLLDGIGSVEEARSSYTVNPALATVFADIAAQDAAFQDAFIKSFYAAKTLYAQAAAEIRADIPGAFKRPTAKKKPSHDTKLLLPK